MRGFGAVQVCFAHEAQMDKLAVALDIDPVELRLAQRHWPPAIVLPTGQIVDRGRSGAGVHRGRRRVRAATGRTAVDEYARPGGAGRTADAAWRYAEA